MDLYLSIQRHNFEFPDCQWHKSDIFNQEIPVFKEFPEYNLAKSYITNISKKSSKNLIFISKRHRPKKKNYVEYIYYFNHSNPFKLKVRFKDIAIYAEDRIIEHGKCIGKILKYDFSDDEYQ